MGGTKLCLLLLLGTYTLAQQDVDGQSATCFLAKRFKNFKRFVYDYEAETLNSVHGGSVLKSGSKVSCKVEIDVPQTCSFILRTRDCSLSEASDINDDRAPMYYSADGDEAFKVAMAKNPLKILVEGETGVQLFPEEDEPKAILNVKRGIVSALMVPAMEEERSREMATLHGVCLSDITVDSTDATDVTITRDLSKCDSFTAQRESTSPLALISGLHYPLSKLIGSTQTCNYKFDNSKKHMTSGTCTEKHILLPFSHQAEYGISTLVQQTLTLTDTHKINDRIFDYNNANTEFLPMEAVADKAATQTKDAALALLGELVDLGQTTNGHQRTSIFQRLVTELRGLKAEVLRDAAPMMMTYRNPEVSRLLTLQALVQCGTPECTSAMLRIFRTAGTASKEGDYAVYALSLLPSPTSLLVEDMLAMAQYKQSRLIMFALSNVVEKVFQSGLTKRHQAIPVAPEITAVSRFMASILGTDCAGDKEKIFLALRVIGNMGDAMEAADPTIRTTLLKCMRQPTTTLSVQLAAIRAFRRMSLTDEVRANLQRVSIYAKGAVQKRLAAYLILMKDPKTSDLEMVKKILRQEQNVQVKAFVSSHIYNIITDRTSQSLAKRIKAVLQITDLPTHNNYPTISSNYKLGMAHPYLKASTQGNIIFDPSSLLPREVLLQTTMEVLGHTMDMWEVGMEGKGFEPTIEALRFIPDTVSKAFYWAVDKMPWAAPLRNSNNVPENLIREVTNNFNKMMKELSTQDSPETMAYLKIMGTELAYIKASDLRDISNEALMYANIFMNLPQEVMKTLMSKTDNELFAHYIFMDNKFSLSTASGFPLKFALSGIFAPGAKGGLRLTSNMQEVSFMPSVGIEFVTKMGVHVPEFVDSAVEIHTSMYHESALNAKITLERNQVKLSIPAPQGTNKLFRISNQMLLVNSGQRATVIPPKGESWSNVGNCKPLFTGLNYCTTAQYSMAGTNTASQYLPLIGKAKFAVDIQPTGQVSEYTATVAYKLLSEGKEGRHKVDSLKMVLKAEGSQPTEASVNMKYNRNRNVFTTNVQIPDYDVEMGVRLGMADSSSKGKSITFDITNKNIPQLSLIGRAKLQAMTDGTLQVQLIVPAMKTDAAITATMTNSDGIVVEIKSDVKLPQTSSVQGIIFKYGEDQAEIGLTSDMSADIGFLKPYQFQLLEKLEQLVKDLMNQQVMTDVKVSHIVHKALEAEYIWMEKMGSDIPYLLTLRNSMAELEMPTMPEKLFLNLGSNLRYQFNKDRMTITLPLPLGGKTSQELRIPSMLTTPGVSLPQLGVEISHRDISIPTFTIPSDYDLTLPLLGMVDVSAKVNSNYYNLEGMVSAGNNTEGSPSYQATFKVVGDSPVELLSFTYKGAAEISDSAEEVMQFTLNGSLKHKLIDTSVEVLERITITDKVLCASSYKIRANSGLGLETSLDITSQYSLASNMLTGNVNMDGGLKAGPKLATTSYSQTFSAEPMKKEARTEATLRVNMEPLRHTTGFIFGYKDAKLTIKAESSSSINSNDRMIGSRVDLTASRAGASIRVENRAEYTVNSAYSLLSGSMNPSGIEINTDSSLNIFASRASHKATMTLNMNGLTTSCTTTAQKSPMNFENVVHGGVDSTGATLTITTKGSVGVNDVELTIDGKAVSSEVSLNSIFKANAFDASTRNMLKFKVNEDGISCSNNMVGSYGEMRTDTAHTLKLALKALEFSSKTDNVLNTRNSYKHDVTVDMKPFTALVIVKNDLKILEVSFSNEAQFKAEPYTMQLAGRTEGFSSDEQLSHTYEIKFADMIFSTKTNTHGQLLGSQMTHTSDMNIADWTVAFNNLAKLNTPSLTLENTIKTIAAPFHLNIEASLKSNGDIYLYGRQSGDLNSNFLLKAEPLAVTQAFECRASTAHELENGVSIKANINNRFNSMLSLKEQSVTMVMASKINNHALDHELTAINNAEKTGMELKGALSTNIFNGAGENQDYSISGLVNYDKSSDSQFIQVPFMEHLPAVIEEVKNAFVRLVDNSIDTLRNIDYTYEISARVQRKVKELKDVIDTFDSKMFIQDLQSFVRSVENHIYNLIMMFPTKEVIDIVESVNGIVMTWIKENKINNKIRLVYVKIEEILSNYEVEKIIEQIMDEAIVIMKQYRIRERIHAALAALKSVDVQPMLNKFMEPVKEVINEMYAFDYKQMIDSISTYCISVIEKIRSFDYETVTLEVKDKVMEMTKIPCFGKLSGDFRIVSPNYRLTTTADLANTTLSPATPEFIMNLNSQATSTFELLAHTVDASVNLALPDRSSLSLSENFKALHTAFTVDHQGKMTLFGLTARASANTIAKATTEPYEAELVSNAVFLMDGEMSASMYTTYKHEVNMPLLGISSEASANQNAVARLNDGILTVNVNNQGNGKYAVQDYSDDAATHKSDMKAVFDIYTAKVTFTGETDCKHFKMNDNIIADIDLFRHIIFEAKAETETPFLKNSVAELKVQAKDLKIGVTASHNAVLVGQVDGTLASSILASVAPYELTFDTKNKGNVKVTLPNTLIGKADFQNDVAITVNSDVQQASWIGLARFNQFKYSHYLTMDNGEREIQIFARVNGDANLDLLKKPINDYSLWEDTGLSTVLTTTQQTVAMETKLTYTKNPEVITIDIDMEPVFDIINENAKILQANLKFPSALNGLSLPQIKLPIMPRSIILPVLGDISYEFSMKSDLATLKTDASIMNQGDIVVKLTASSTSRFEDLDGKIEGTTTMNRVNGLKLASLLSVKHKLAEGTHDSTISINNRALDASITNSAKVNLPVFKFEMNQEIFANPQEGLVVSMSCPSSGLVGFQVQTKLPAQVRGRLYGRYPSEPSNDVEILAMKMSSVTFEKLSVQTTWNMEMPYEMMLGLKKAVPAVSNPIGKSYNEITKLAKNLRGPFEEAKRQGKVMLKRASDQFKAVDLSKLTTRVSDSTLLILKGYQKSIRIILDAAVKFLRETRFQIPGYAERMSGLEAYQKMSTFIAEVSEEAIVKVPEFFASNFEAGLEYFRGLEFRFPGSGRIVKGEEVLDDLLNALRKIQLPVRAIVKYLGDIQLEDIIKSASKLMNVLVEKTEELFSYLNSNNLEKLSTWARNVYADAVNSDILAEVTKQLAEARRIVVEYINVVKRRFQQLLADVSIEQLQADLQSWINSLVKRLNAFHNKVIGYLKESTKHFEPFVRVGDRQIDIDIPLPLIAK